MSRPQSDTLRLRHLFRTSSLSVKAAVVLSTWFGSGLVPVAPGTFGTLAAAPLVLLMNDLGIPLRALGLCILIGVALWSAGRTRDLLNREDPPEVVIDEVAGFSFTMFFLPASWLSLGLGFLAFRLFDIWKPFPIRKLEALKGASGIIADDLAAGLYASLSARIVLSLTF
jgi:phosphatidylglycerophosphatase A